LKKLVDFTTRQLKQALEALRGALESHHRSLERLESTLIEFEETLTGREDRQERPQAKRQGGEARSLDLLSITEVSQELVMSKNWVYGRIRSGEIPSTKLGPKIKVRREDLEGYLARQGVRPITRTPLH
jgi:excisionase family DNA binding protein